KSYRKLLSSNSVLIKVIIPSKNSNSNRFSSYKMSKLSGEHSLENDNLVEYVIFYEINLRLERGRNMYQANPGFVLREIAGEYILISIAGNTEVTGNIMMLNDTGCFIWKLLEKPKSFEEIILAVKDCYNDDNLIESDIKEFIQSMLKNKLIIERGI
ncbi:MAG: PqqD family protein, partial [Anaerostipes sp.]|nr:PqqD family protein [Anaerostipes sp.]